MLITEHVLSVPLDHAHPGGESIEIFAREVADRDGAQRPALLFLQGGPGVEAARPTAVPPSPAWLGRALRDYRVILLDQRGTGRSTPYGAPGPDPVADAERLAHFRADAIIDDAEALREHLGLDRWSVLGQSFGGFCALHYLSTAPERLDAVYFTGGLPPVGRPVEEVYAATFARTRRLNERYLRRFPEDQDRRRRVLERADAGQLRLPDGSPVSRRLFRTIGIHLGNDGGADTIHYLLERDPASPAFCYDLAALLPFGGRNPLYAVLHESCYADGVRTAWASQRVLPEDFQGQSPLLSAEHLFPWHFEDDPALAPYREVADVLAHRDWPSLYDAERLTRADVPCAAAIYADDPFVERSFSEQTADLLPRMNPWLTNEFLHNGLYRGDRVLDRLIGLVREA